MEVLVIAARLVLGVGYREMMIPEVGLTSYCRHVQQEHRKVSVTALHARDTVFPLPPDDRHGHGETVALLTPSHRTLKEERLARMYDISHSLRPKVKLVRDMFHGSQVRGLNRDRMMEGRSVAVHTHPGLASSGHWCAVDESQTFHGMQGWAGTCLMSGARSGVRSGAGT